VELTKNPFGDAKFMTTATIMMPVAQAKRIIPWRNAPLKSGKICPSLQVFGSRVQESQRANPNISTTMMKAPMTMSQR
jgi:hypothetical protein